MKTPFIKSIFIAICSSFLLAGTCSKDDTPNDDDATNPYQTLSQDVINQSFFIEGIYITGPGRDEVNPVPNAVGQQPVSGKEYIEIIAGFPESETVYFGIIGQRLLNETVSGANEIVNTLVAQPFDYSNIVFAVDREDDNHAPNATLQSIESISYVPELNDIFSQVNNEITQSKFRITALEEGVLGYTSNGSPIQTITFEANPEAFIEAEDGNIVSRYTTYIFSYDELLANTFSNSIEININILERVRNISSSRDRVRYYGLDD